jgi:hypothetical protein
VREDLDAEIAHGDDIRRGRSCASTSTGSREDSSELPVVVGNDDANAESTDDEEDPKTPVDGLEGVFDIDTGPLGFGGNLNSVSF